MGVKRSGETDRWCLLQVDMDGFLDSSLSNHLSSLVLSGPSSKGTGLHGRSLVATGACSENDQDSVWTDLSVQVQSDEQEDVNQS